MDMLEVIKRRSSLLKFIDAISRGNATVGFMGGSITDQSTGNRWPEYVLNWLVHQFPQVRFYAENAAIGATGSDLAVFRVEKDLIQRGCDIIFIEYAVNDFQQPVEIRMRAREGLIRKVLSAECDCVIVYTYCQEMYKDILSGILPDSIRDFEKLAIYYNVSSIWMGLSALKEVKAGQIRWEEWLPDGLHPEYRGSYCYAQSVITFLYDELVVNPQNDRTNEKISIPYPINTKNWENNYLIPFTKLNLQGPWLVRRWSRMAWADQVLDTAAVGARLSFSFTGRGIALGFDFGKTSAEFRYSLDGTEWVDIVRERPSWCGDSGWFRISVLSDELPYCEHWIEIEVTHGNYEECKGTNFRLVFIGVIQ